MFLFSKKVSTTDTETKQSWSILSINPPSTPRQKTLPSDPEIWHWQVFSQGVLFAPLGLIDMYNSGGAIEALSSTSEPPGCKIKIKVRGCGRFGAYSNSEPIYCMVDMKEEEFTYNTNDGLLTVTLGGDCSFREIEIVYWVKLELKWCEFVKGVVNNSSSILSFVLWERMKLNVQQHRFQLITC